MVLRPRRPYFGSRTAQDLIGPLRENSPGLAFYVLRIVEMDLPIASVGELRKHLAIHDGVGAGFVWRATLDGDVVGEVQRPGSKRDRLDRCR